MQSAEFCRIRRWLPRSAAKGASTAPVGVTVAPVVVTTEPTGARVSAVVAWLPMLDFRPAAALVLAAASGLSFRLESSS